jgi:hypothetical protein
MRMTKTINAINANRLIMKLSTRSIHNPNSFTCFRQIVAHPGGVTRAFARRYLINWKFLGQAICRAVFTTTAVFRIFGLLLARIFHAWIEQRSGEGVIRLVSPSQNENTTHRFFWYRL